MKKSALNTMALLALLIVMVTDSCKKSDNGTPTSKYAVSLATSVSMGQYLVDKKGYTLYFFAEDYNGKASCTGSCEASWPYFYTGPITQADLGTGLKIADFDTINSHGKTQSRYKGWPLYYFAPNGTALESPGQISGEGILDWFVAKPDYTIMLAVGQMVGGNGKNYLSNYTEGIGNTTYFTDAHGVTLYTFTSDSANINKFTKPDFSNNASWSIYDTTAIVVPSVLDKAQFSSFSLYGKHQLSYKGWPLYYYGGDNKTQGLTKGITVGTIPGSKWPVAVQGMTAAPHK